MLTGKSSAIDSKRSIIFNLTELISNRQAENTIINRSVRKLMKIKDNIYSYLLTPKNAFLEFNEDNSGKMTFDQFNKFIIRLS
jgi:hypothetical protein